MFSVSKKRRTLPEDNQPMMEERFMRKVSERIFRILLKTALKQLNITTMIYLSGMENIPVL